MEGRWPTCRRGCVGPPVRSRAVPDHDVAISVTGLTKSYGNFVAVGGIDFEVRRGEVLALLGPNGAGQDHLGRDPRGLPQARRRHGLGVGSGPRAAVHAASGPRWASSSRNAPSTLPDGGRGGHPAGRSLSGPAPVGEVIELVGLEAKARARVKTLSGGQQRRLDLGLALVGDPELIFLDEPTTGFDPSARREAWDVVRGLCAEGRTVVLTTHYMDEAQALADTVVVIAAGRVVASGSPDTLGGRDHGETTVRFVLPAGCGSATCPCPGV